MDVAGKILVERKRITTTLWSIFSVGVLLSVPQNGQNRTQNSSYALAEGLGENVEPCIIKQRERINLQFHPHYDRIQRV
jgi:hypothetical protein